MDIWGSGAEVRLFWKKTPGAVAYNVYRRDYRAGGACELIGEDVRQTFFTDKDVPRIRSTAIVVTAIDAGTHEHALPRGEQYRRQRLPHRHPLPRAGGQ